MIRITAKKDGFRRAGRVHYGTRDYPDGAFTPRELAALKAEPMLVVEEIPEPRRVRTPEREKAAGQGNPAPAGLKREGA